MMLASRLLFLEFFRIDSLHGSGVFGVRWRSFDSASASPVLLWSFAVGSSSKIKLVIFYEIV